MKKVLFIILALVGFFFFSCEKNNPELNNSGTGKKSTKQTPVEKEKTDPNPEQKPDKTDKKAEEINTAPVGKSIFLATYCVEDEGKSYGKDKERGRECRMTIMKLADDGSEIERKKDIFLGWIGFNTKYQEKKTNFIIGKVTRDDLCSYRTWNNKGEIISTRTVSYTYAISFEEAEARFRADRNSNSAGIHYADVVFN